MARNRRRQSKRRQDPVREMRDDHGRAYSGTAQQAVPEPPGHRPQGDKPLAGYDIKNKPKRQPRP